MEYHLAYSNQVRGNGEKRPHQQVQLDWLAIFSTYEEARLYIQMIAAIDKHHYGQDKNGDYFAHALPFDPPLDQYDNVFVDDNCAGWQLESYPWHSMFHYPLLFNGQGEREHRRECRSFGFETRTLRDYCAGICAGESPRFGCGDLVCLRDWDNQPVTFAVVAGLLYEGGVARGLKSTDVWRGWYHLLIAGPYGIWDEDVHTTWACEILPLSGELPEDKRILEVLSRHYKGESIVPEDVLKRLMKGGVTLTGCELFPFYIFDEIDTPT